MRQDRLQIRNEFIKSEDKPYRTKTNDSINYTEHYVKWLEDELVKSNSVLGDVRNCIHCGEDESKHPEYAKICPSEFNCFERNDC